MTKCYCDHCCKEINYRDGYIGETFSVMGDDYHVDLCEQCYAELGRTLDKLVVEFCCIDK